MGQSSYKVFFMRPLGGGELALARRGVNIRRSRPARGHMTLCLSNADVKAVQSAVVTLASALDFESVDAWAAQAMRDVTAVLGADKAYFALPTADAVHTAAMGERADDGMAAYLSYYWRTDFVLMSRRAEMGLEVYHRDMLYQPGEMARDELHNDWCIPHGLHDTLGMGFDVEPGQKLPALLHVYHHRSSSKSFGDRGVQLMQLLLPSFKAGVAAWRTLYERRQALASALDVLGAAMAMFDADGAMLHRTPALTALLQADVDRALIEQTIADFGRTVAMRTYRLRATRGCSQLTPTTRVLVTCLGRYTVRSCVAPSALTGKPMVLVIIERPARSALDVGCAAARFGLTEREAMVAQLLARGQSTAAIANALKMSRHTVRHHIEHIMGKVDAHSRAEVVARLTNARLGDEASHPPEPG